MRIHDYTVTDADNITAELLNQVTDDFSNAMTEAWLEVEELKRRNTAFKDLAGQSMNYLISRISSLSTSLTGLKISAYNPVVSSSNIQLDNVYGQLSLAESNRVTHIPTAEDNYGRYLAVNGVSIKVGRTSDPADLADNEDARAILDDEGEIWKETRTAADTDAGSIWVVVATPLSGVTPNFVSLYPLAGTTIQTVEVKRAASYTTWSPNTTWPVKYHQNFSDYQNEVRFKIAGVLNSDGDYDFYMKKLDIYSVTYASEGWFMYTTEDVFTTVASVTVTAPFFYPTASALASMYRVQIYNTGTTTAIYDSHAATGPFTGTGGKLDVKVTLYKTEGNTPFITSVI